MENEKTLWGVKEGDEDWKEHVLCTQVDRFEEVKKLATRDGFGRFRISDLDLNKKPNFKNTVNP